MFVFRDPVERLQVAQAALALLDVGFQHVALAALLAMARAAFLELGLDELAHRAVEELLAQPAVCSSAPTASVPQRNRISSRLVRIVMSCFPSRRHSFTVREAWPTFMRRSHSM
jgi:hypothetical protein